MEMNDKPILDQAINTTHVVGIRICPNCGIRLSAEINVCPNDKTVLIATSSLGGNLSEQYEILEEIGAGGMGVIYKARHKTMNTFVAIKMLQINRMDQSSIQRFSQEAKAISLLDHPAIVRIRDYGVMDSGQPYMVLDYIDAPTLQETIAWKGCCSMQDGINIFIQVADALAHAHERGILHRDLKPSNIMLVEGDDGLHSVKIVDFGIAKFVESAAHDGSHITTTGDVLGSPLYMSPEQASGKKVDHRSDIYSLGCVIYEALTGQVPFNAETAVDVIFKQLHEDPKPLREYSSTSKIPNNVEAVILKALNKNPDERFQSMRELCYAIFETQADKRSDGSKSARHVATFITPARIAIVLLGCAVTVTLIFIMFLSGRLGLIPGQHFKSTGKDKLPPNQIEPLAIAFKEDLPLAVINGQKNKISVKSRYASDQSMAAFDQFTITEQVDLSTSQITAGSLSHLVHLPHLKVLKLSNCSLEDRGSLDIAQMSKLQDLLLDRTDITDRGLEPLIKLKNLEMITVAGDKITDRGLQLLSQIKSLKTVCLTLTPQVSATGLASLASLPKLTKLELEGDDITPEKIRALRKCKKLMHIKISGTNMSNEVLKAVTDIKTLRYVILERCLNLTDEGLAYVAMLPNLHRLDLGEDNWLDNKGFLSLANLMVLKELHIVQCQNVTGAAVQAFKKRRPDVNFYFQFDQHPNGDFFGT